CANLATYVSSRFSPLSALAQSDPRPARAVPAPCDEEQVLARVFGVPSDFDPAREPIEPILVEPVDPGLIPDKLRPEALPPPETEEPAHTVAVELKVPFMPYADTPRRLDEISAEDMQRIFGSEGGTI